MRVYDLLKLLADSGASDLHLAGARPPALRTNGELTPQSHMGVLTFEDITQAFTDITTEEQRSRFFRELELDFAVEMGGTGRFRVNVSMQRGSLNLSIRVVQTTIPSIDRLLLPHVCKALALKDHGLILIAGPAGSGKSTTLAAMIGHINDTRQRRIVTIEDPIEFVHQDNKCFISQREVGSDTKSFANALRHALRQDPDVILVGEMRDLDTADTALAAAETGHLVLSTLHTPSAPQAVDRMVAVFPPHQQPQARIQLSTTLEGVLYQNLVPRADGDGRIVAAEVMIASDAIRNLIRDGRTPQMVNAMQTGSKSEMQTLDQALVDLYRRGQIRLEDALGACRDQEVLKKTVNGLDGTMVGLGAHPVAAFHREGVL